MAKAKMSFKPKQTTKKILKDLKDRARDVIARRYGLDEAERHTLQSIGDTYGITRERVRQIENTALHAIRESASFEEAAYIFSELKDILHDFGGIVEEDHFLSTLSKDPITQNHIHLYLVLGDEFNQHKENDHFKKRWSVDDTIADQVHTVLNSIHSSLTKDELYEEADILHQFLNHDHAKNLDEKHQNEDTARNWFNLSKVIQKNPLGHWGHAESPNIKTRGIRDLAYLVLRQHGSPMHFREVAEAISEQFGRPTHTATCHNELIKDDRFVLIGRGLYALKEWGYRQGTAREVIQQILEEEGRAMSRDEIVDRVMKERYLKKNTILVNLQDPKNFKKDSNGLYTILSS
ncbi:hypothetical protein H6776_02945 [Candidatus Nomurabacteria bacterium]|nr:hypothetical protein [Candidatus Nomurabacteria bacterium]